MLVAGGEIVGAQVAFYCERQIDGEPQRFCNLGAWCVAPEYRAHGLRLVSAALARKGFTFTDLSPSGNVVPLNKRLGFQSLDTRTSLVFNLPSPPSGGVRLITDPVEIEATLRAPDLAIFRDHRTARAAHQLVIVRGDQTCHVVFRRDRRKRLPLFATILHASDAGLFQDCCGHLFNHLLLRCGIPMTLIEERIAPCRPWHAIELSKSRPRMFRSSSLDGQSIDYLYSELVCVPW